VTLLISAKSTRAARRHAAEAALFQQALPRRSWRRSSASMDRNTTASGTKRLLRYAELFISVPVIGFLGHAREKRERQEPETRHKYARAYSPRGSCIPILARLCELPFRFRRFGSSELDAGIRQRPFGNLRPWERKLMTGAPFWPGWRKAPAHLHHLNGFLAASKDRRGLGWPNVVSRFQVRCSLWPSQRNPYLAESAQIVVVGNVIAEVVTQKRLSLSSFGSGEHQISFPTAACRAHQPVAPVENRSRSAIVLSYFGGVRLDLMPAFLHSDRSSARAPRRHSRASLVGRGRVSMTSVPSSRRCRSRRLVMLRRLRGVADRLWPQLRNV
jgi:hypothetical protein